MFSRTPKPWEAKCETKRFAGGRFLHAPRDDKQLFNAQGRDVAPQKLGRAHPALSLYLHFI